MPERTRFILREVLEWAVLLVIAAAVGWLLREFVMSPYQVPTGSMEPTIQVGDSIFAQKVSLALGEEPEQGDIVVFENPDASSGHDILVKRVIAREGQTVDLAGGVVYVDGEPLDEPYAQGESFPLPLQAAGVEISYPLTVPEGCVWMMGDNRENSADSRYFGPVPLDNILGIAFLRYWPLDRIGLLD